jgi:23S rRNA (cytidine1920-2'-O)/16S rRNA (cytidine1409-2'-O)-methyltransferase
LIHGAPQGALWAMMRIDQLLVQRGLASTRSQAQRLIGSGVQCRTDGAWKRVVKNGDLVEPDCEIELLDTSEARFVSRGGLKLDGALAHVGLEPAGWFCLDLGQSTGGFTDCLLQRGARHVVGIDVGYGQLHDQLRQDVRVTCVERVNARHLGAMIWQAFRAR